MIPLEGLLDLYLEAEREWRDVSRPQARSLESGWRASSLGYCLRRQYLEHLGVPRTREIDTKTRRTFAWGDQVHTFAKRTLWRLGVVAEDELALSDGARNLTGHVDLVLRWPPAPVEETPAELLDAWSEDWRAFLRDLRRMAAERFPDVERDGFVGLELKSAKSSAMRYLMRDGPRYEHRIQVGAYMAMAERSHPAIARWAIAYIGKDAVGILTYGAAPSWRDEAIERVERLEAWRLAEADPADVPCECEGWAVKYCPYASGETCCLREAG